MSNRQHKGQQVIVLQLGRACSSLWEFFRGALSGDAPCQRRSLGEREQRLSAQELYMLQLQHRYSRPSRCC